MGKRVERVGERIKSNNCGFMEIIEYNGCQNIKVRFDSSYVAETTYNNFKQRRIKDPLFKSVLNKGYFGIGDYKAKIKGNNTKEYDTWKSMLYRAYDPYTLNKGLTYIDVEVCDEWLCFQNFAKWYEENFYQIPGKQTMSLDKDLIKRNSKIYSPEFCNFVPQSINSLLIKSDNNRGAYPIGVTFDKRSQMYMTRLSVDGKLKHLGNYNTSKKNISGL